jgi:hypothetical protein
MPIKILGVIVGLIGLAMIVFAMFAWRELQVAAASPSTPSPASMPLTNFVSPGLFDSGNAGERTVKPAELARVAFNKIYIFGGGSFALIVVGILMVGMRGNTNRAN